MRLLPNFRARLKEAFERHLDEWRPGGERAEAAPSQREARAAFVADPEPAAEPSPLSPTRHAAADPWAAAASRAPGDGAAAGSRVALLARLRNPDSLREAFVVKEILDLPVGLRPLRGRGVRS